MISDQQRRAAFNNDYANAALVGDPRYHMKQYDRAGVSRGAGTFNQASTQAAQQFAQGVADAYSNRDSMDQYNQAQGMQQKQSTDTYNQSMSALRQQQVYQDSLARLQRANMGMNFATSLLGGLLG